MLLTVWAPERGRLSVTARGLRRVSGRVRKAGRKLSVPLSASAVTALHHHAKTRLKPRIHFAPTAGHNSSSITPALG